MRSQGKWWIIDCRVKELQKAPLKGEKWWEGENDLKVENRNCEPRRRVGAMDVSALIEVSFKSEIIAGENHVI